MKNAFRSWRINQLCFWGNVGVAIITIGLSWYRSTATDFFIVWAMTNAAIGVGAIKRLWYNYDIVGTLIAELCGIKTVVFARHATIKANVNQWSSSIP